MNKGSILYFAWYMLPGAWQIGLSPTITYDLKADPGNKLNLPIGLSIGKTLKIGKVPTKFQLGFDYSLVRQDNLGQSWKIKLAITPVIPGLISKPLFGG